MGPHDTPALMQIIGVGAAIMPMAVLGVVLTIASRPRRAPEPDKPPAPEV